MSEIIHIRSDEQWRLFCHQYLARNSFCVMCEERGELTPSTMVHQPTPGQDKLKKRYRDYNVKAICQECFLTIQVNALLRQGISKMIRLVVLLTVISLFIKLIF